MDSLQDTNTLKRYAEEVKERLQGEKRLEQENLFLRSSLRTSERLRTIEKHRRTLQVAERAKQAELNIAFEDDDEERVGAMEFSEVRELIAYLRTKMDSSEFTFPTIQGESLSRDSGQWEWLCNALRDPVLSKSILMHDLVEDVYDRFSKSARKDPQFGLILPGRAQDFRELVTSQLLNAVHGSIDLQPSVLNDLFELHGMLTDPLLKGLVLAMDGLANTWLRGEGMLDEDLDSGAEVNGDNDDDESVLTDGEIIERSVIPGCYAKLAYDEEGRYSHDNQRVQLKYVVLQKENTEFLGATVSCKQRSIIIARIINGGLIQKTGLLHEGDELLTVNDVELLGKDLNTVTDILSSLSGEIVFLVAPVVDSYAEPTIQRDLISLRALFAYEPEEDRYLGCRELGLKFDKGDIIHVTGTSDPKWWQAYRRDESTLMGAVGSLAGLIPSPMYQRQRAVFKLNQLLITEPDEVELEKASGSSSDESAEENTNVEPKSGRQFSFTNLPIIKRIFRDKTSSTSAGSPVSPNRSANLRDTGHAPSVSSNTQQDSVYLNHAVLGTVYGERFSAHDKPHQQPSDEAVGDWSAAGPVWGPHGYDITTTHTRTRKAVRRSDTTTSTVCWKESGNVKRRRNKRKVQHVRVPTVALQNLPDPVAWLDKEVSDGFLCHPSLWTYEPVMQYLPQPCRPRPLVLLGPVHVGRQQLMQSIILADQKKFSPAAIHTTNVKLQSTSVTPYIHVTPEVFDDLRKQKDFIEWGRFNRQYYGTSKSTIRAIVESEKVCCISLRPESLRMIRASRLMPFVIFISPPDCVDDLRKLQERMGLPNNCSDGELKACIDASRSMEFRFGHWFDEVVIPDTLETTTEELLMIATRLEREISWVSRTWK